MTCTLCTTCTFVFRLYCVLLQDALNDAEDIKSVENERNGIKFYDYEIASPVRHTNTPACTY